MKDANREIDRSEIYSCAREIFRAVRRLARTDSRQLNEGLERYALRTQAHSSAATKSSSLGNRALRYAEASALRLLAFVDAASDAEQAPPLASKVRELVRRFLRRLDAALESRGLNDETPPSKTTVERRKKNVPQPVRPQRTDSMTSTESIPRRDDGDGQPVDSLELAVVPIARRG
jgi:hypothetical protein